MKLYNNGAILSKQNITGVLCNFKKKKMCLENTVSNLFFGLKLVDLFGPKSNWAQHPLGYPLSMKMPKFLTCVWHFSEDYLDRSIFCFIVNLARSLRSHPIHFNKRALFHKLFFFSFISFMGI